MITSKRKFGIEIEFSAPTATALRKISDAITVVRDGSLDTLRNAGEHVSQILQGQQGESHIHQACEILKKNKADTPTPETSIHVHLDGQSKGGELRSSRLRPTMNDRLIFGVSNKLKDVMSVQNITNALLGGFHPTKAYKYVSKFEGITYYSLAELTRAPKLNYTYYWIEKPNRFNWLRNVFYFYTQFSDVMEDIVSNSRKFGNMYCLPLGKSYDLSVIEGAKNMQELKNVWYKGRGANGHYDDSRYHNVNLHCFWDRHGTVEIRSHGGTIDPYKILMWVKLHQKIVDKLETMELNDIKFTGNLHKEFIDFVEEPILQEYVKRLLGYYSNINIK